MALRAARHRVHLLHLRDAVVPQRRNRGTGLPGRSPDPCTGAAGGAGDHAEAARRRPRRAALLRPGKVVRGAGDHRCPERGVPGAPGGGGGEPVAHRVRRPPAFHPVEGGRDAAHRGHPRSRVAPAIPAQGLSMGFPLGLLLMLQQPPPVPTPIIVDGHIDTPQRMLDRHDDISARLADGQVDIPRMKEGGLTAAFFSIWVDARYGPGSAYRRAADPVGAAEGPAATQPTVEVATSAGEGRGAAAPRHIAAPPGGGGGDPIEDSLEKLDSLYTLGVRYMTLTWNNGNDWAGASTDPHRAGGLTAFGKRVVRRMNELGMLVDVSHVSDSTFWDVLATSSRPVIASHSSCRALAHHPRNLTDE